MRMREVLAHYTMDEICEEVLFALGYREDGELPDTAPIVEVVEKILAGTDNWPGEIMVFGHQKLDWMFITWTVSVYSFRDVVEFERKEVFEELSIEPSPGLEDGWNELLWHMNRERLIELLKYEQKSPIPMKDVPLEMLSGAIMCGTALPDPACAIAEYLVENGLMEAKHEDPCDRCRARDQYRAFDIDVDDPLNDARRELFLRWVRYREIHDWRNWVSSAYLARLAREKLQKEREKLEKGEKKDGI